MSDTITFKLELVPQIESILSQSVTDEGKLVTSTNSDTLPLCFRKPTKDCQLQLVDVIDLELPATKNPWYTGITFLPGDRIMFADHDNKQCILLSSSYQFITSHTLTGVPWNVCVLDENEVAVSFLGLNKIQILSVIDDVINPVRSIETNCRCDGITDAGKGQMVINDGVQGCWSLISSTGEVKASHQYDSDKTHCNYIAMNNAKTRVYVAVHCKHSLCCFDMDGQSQFTCSPISLKYPLGVAVDRDDNIYVLGYWANNIHQLSPDGSVIQVITSGVPEYPSAILFHKYTDMCIVTSRTYKRKLHIYHLN